jgi:Domain of unknown function (DUF6268)
MINMKNKLIINKWACRFAVAGMTLMALPVLAADTQDLNDDTAIPAPSEQPNTAPNPPMSVSTGLAEQFNTGLKTGGGTLSVTKFQAGLMAPIRLSDAYILNISVRYGLDSYEFKALQPQWFGAWHNIDTITVAPILQCKIDDQWSAYGGGLLRESGENFQSGVTGGGIAGFNYKYSDTLTFGAGLGVVDQIEDHATVLPLLTANWKFADDWSLKLGLSDVATTGYGIKVIYNFSPQWEFSAGLQHQKARFRIEGNGQTINGQTSSDGVGQDETTTIYAAATWHATDNLDVDGYMGMAVGGKLTLDNSTGTQIIASDYNSAAVIGVKASYRF